MYEDKDTKEAHRRVSFFNGKLMEHRIENLKESINHSKNFIENYEKKFPFEKMLKSKRPAKKNLIALSFKDSKNDVYEKFKSKIKDTKLKNTTVYPNVYTSTDPDTNTNSNSNCLYTMNSFDNSGNNISLGGKVESNKKFKFKEDKLIYSKVFNATYSHLQQIESETIKKENTTNKNLYVEKKINCLKTKIHFINEVYNYAYPRIMIERIKLFKKLKEKNDSAYFSGNCNLFLNANNVNKEKHFLFSNSTFNKFRKIKFSKVKVD